MTTEREPKKKPGNRPWETLPLLTLSGDFQESFYQLGLKDQKGYERVKNHLAAIILPNLPGVDHLLKGGLFAFAQYVYKNHPSLKLVLEPYAEGLGISPYSLVAHYLIPEIMSGLHQFLPPWPLPTLGCSSFFSWDEEKKTPLHGRILDFSLVNTYDRNQRGLLYDFPDHPRIWSYSLKGLPYPSLTAMNSEGLTLALHQKFNKTFYPQGTLIFEIGRRILSECHNISSVRKMIPTLKSLTTWGLYLSFKNGEVLCLDLSGDQVFMKEFDLRKEKILYFNNRPLAMEGSSSGGSDYPPSSLVPLGMEHYCRMREISADKKIKALPSASAEGRLLKAMGKPLIRKSPGARTWGQDVITFNTIATVIMNAGEGRTLWLPGPAPKILKDKVQEIDQLWTRKGPLSSRMVGTGYKGAPPSFVKGMRHLAKVTAAYDKKIFWKAYHHIQMAINHLDGYAEKSIAEFYFLVFQYIHTPSDKEFPLLLNSFLAMEGKLPPYLEDHRLLFLLRLGKITGGGVTFLPRKPNHPVLQALYHWENDLPSQLIKVLRNLMFPQIGILDIVYAYYKGP